MKKMKRTLTILMCVCMCLSLFGGCASKPEAPAAAPASAEKTETAAAAPAEAAKESIAGEKIVVWTFLDPVAGTTGRDIALAQMIESFEAETGAVVVVEPVEHSKLPAKFLAANNVGNAPDIVWLTASEFGNAVNQGALEPLENLFLSDWTDEMLADAESGSFRGGMDKNGLHYQIPNSVNTISLVYRSDLLKEAGFDFSDGSSFENWAEFKEAIKTLTVEKDELTGTKRYGYGSVFPASAADSILVSNMLIDEYGTLWNEDGTANYANEAGLAGVEFITELYEGGYIPDTSVTDTIENLYEDFKAGKYAMINCPSTRLLNIVQGCSFDPTTVHMMPYPGDNGDYSASVIGGWGAAVWSGSKCKLAAGKFLEYMFLNDYLWVTVGGQPPVLRSTTEKLDAEGWFDDPEHAFVRDIQNTISNGTIPQPSDYTILGWRNDISLAIQEVLVNGADPTEALIAAEKAFNERNGK